MSRRPAAWSGAWLLWAGVVAAAPADDSAERARIASDRQAVEARYDAARRDCETRFVVNDCLDQARQARRHHLRRSRAGTNPGPTPSRASPRPVASLGPPGNPHFINPSALSRRAW